jgi:hypothetical protein
MRPFHWEKGSVHEVPRPRLWGDSAGRTPHLGAHGGRQSEMAVWRMWQSPPRGGPACADFLGMFIRPSGDLAGVSRPHSGWGTGVKGFIPTDRLFSPDLIGGARRNRLAIHFSISASRFPPVGMGIGWPIWPPITRSESNQYPRRPSSPGEARRGFGRSAQTAGKCSAPPPRPHPHTPPAHPTKKRAPVPTRRGVRGAGARRAPPGGPAGTERLCREPGGHPPPGTGGTPNLTRVRKAPRGIGRPTWAGPTCRVRAPLEVVGGSHS